MVMREKMEIGTPGSYHYSAKVTFRANVLFFRPEEKHKLIDMIV